MSETAEFQNPIEAQKTDLKECLWNVLESLGRRTEVSTERKARQGEVLANLPDDFWVDFKGGLLSSDYEDYIYSQSKKDERLVEAISVAEVAKQSLDRGKLNMRGLGVLFEALVRADKRIVPVDETPLASQVREFVLRPARFGPLGDRSTELMSSPDLVFVNDNGKISGWVECKAGLLNDRAISQLERFRSSFDRVLDSLEGVEEEDLLRSGLELVARNRDRMGLAERLDLRIAVPLGMYDPRKPGRLIDVGKTCPRSRWVFSNVVLRDYKIMESPFSREELRVMTNFLVNKFITEVKYE